MCGRYTYLFTWQQLSGLLDLLTWPEAELTLRFNVAPTQLAPIVRLNDRGERIGAMHRWGLVPFWADDPSIGSRLINARSETAFEKPAFRKATSDRRCIVPISGFYEWQVIEGERLKRPHYITRTDGEPICLAGVWERWQDKSQPESDPLSTFTILTTTPNPLMRPLHNRMPVILTREHASIWLDPNRPQAELSALLRPFEPDDLTAYPVQRTVNTPKNDDSSLIQPLSNPPGPSGLFI